MSYVSEVLADSPVAYYRLGESSGTTLTDASGNGRNGAYYNAPTLGVAGAVGDGTAVAFDGVSDSAVVPAGPWVPTHTSSWSFECWVKFSATGYATAASVRAPALGTYEITVNLTIGRTSGRIGAETWDWQNAASRVISNVNNNDGAWHHVVVTFDKPTNTLKLYIDGSLRDAKTQGLTGVAGDRSLTLAANNVGSAQHFPGSLDEVALYGGVLSADRVAVHHAAAVGGSVVSLGVVGESDVAFPLVVSADAVVVLGVASEVSAAHGVSVSDGTVLVPLGVASEVSSAFGLAPVLGSAGTRQDVTSGRNRTGVGFASWSPAVVATPANVSTTTQFDKALAFSPVTIVGTQPTFDVTEESVPRHRDRVIVGGRDVTYFRGAEVRVSSYQLMEPFAYGTATLEFPQVYPDYEQIGSGELSWLAPGKRVVIQRVDAAGNIVGTDYKGRLIAPNASTGTFSYEVGGEITGPASLRFRPMPLFRSAQDVGWQIWRALSILGVRTTPRLGVETGIELGRVGGMPFLDYLQSLVGRAYTRTGNQWTVMPNDSGVYETKRKDRTTIHGTVYLSASSASADLRRDIAEEPNRVFATGVTPEMMRVRFGRYPGLQEADDVPFPGFLSEGDSGEDVLTLIHRLRVHGYLNAETAPGGYDSDVAKAVEAVQEDADLTVTGNVNQATWEAIFDTTAMGVSLKLSRIEPAAQKSYTRQYRTSASGAIIGRNPNYDPTRLKIDREVDFGSGFRRPQMREWSRAEIQDGAEPNWVGTLTIHSGAIVAGEHVPGAPILEVLAARDIRPGMNLWLPQFQGGTLVHVTAATVSGDVVTLQVDTRARDAWNVAQVIERDRESRKDPARAFFRRLTKSTTAGDAVGEFSEVGGIITEQELRGGEWNVIEVVAGDSGTIRSLRLDTNPNAESSVAIFGKKVWPKALQREIGDPLSEAGTERWRNENVLDRLRRDHGLLYSAGDSYEPGGYSPGTRGDDGTGILTGRLEDEAGVQYYTDHRPILYVAVWVDRDCTIPAGRIMWPQLEPGV